MALGTCLGRFVRFEMWFVVRQVLLGFYMVNQSTRAIKTSFGRADRIGELTTLSNLPLSNMLENRHSMGQAVHSEVSPKSEEWGYKLGSVYIRKVHFRDTGMSKQIAEKVVNRLRQVTSAIRQDGVNQVSIITSTPERQASIELGKAQAMRAKRSARRFKKSTLTPK
jgi:regulator of protease activity HflC (stomatin/prohibitin superfamily)